MTRVAVTTESESAARIGDLLVGSGMEPVYLPCIRIEPAAAAVLDPVRAAAATADWLVFTSKRAVAIMWPDGGMPAEPAAAAVGAATAAAITAAGGRVTVTGDGGSVELCAAISGRLGGRRVVFPHAAGAAPETAAALRAEAADVVAAPVYQTLPVAPADDPADAVIFGSPSAVAGWQLSRGLEGLVVAAMGSTTARALRATGREPDVVADVPGAPALVTALHRHLDQLVERSSR